MNIRLREPEAASRPQETVATIHRKECEGKWYRNSRGTAYLVLRDGAVVRYEEGCVPSRCFDWANASVVEIERPDICIEGGSVRRVSFRDITPPPPPKRTVADMKPGDVVTLLSTDAVYLVTKDANLDRCKEKRLVRICGNQDATITGGNNEQCLIREHLGTLEVTR